MAFDAGFLHAVTYELNERLTDAKVEKITQPSADEINITFRRFGKTERLCIRAGSNMPRLSLTAIAKENPATPPMFCMLLRKHLGGARLVGAVQLGYERIVRLAFSAYDELGYATEKYLIAEIMGKYSNLMLLDARDRIVGVMRPVDFSTSRVRQVLAGMTYELPPPQEKRPPLEETRDGFFAAYDAFDPDILAEKYLTSTYLGTSLQVARELVHRTAGRSDAALADCPREKFWGVFDDWFTRVRENRYTPTLACDASGAPLDFSYGEITYFSTRAKTETYADLSSLLDAAFTEREKSDRIRARAADLYGILSRATARLEKKCELQTEELAEAEQGDAWKTRGDLVTANLWRLKRGDAVLVAEDYAFDPPRRVEISLDTRMTPAANAQRFYKYYNKAKRARETLTEQLAHSREELRYLESVEAFLDAAESEQDLVEIREELYRAGYASRMKGYAPPKQVKLRPMEFTSPSGYRVVVGRNNTQNDHLTHHLAAKGDLWFHAKGVPGSHVILFCNGEEPPAEDYTYAATLAATYSRAAGDSVPVDYTRVRYVKKPPASKPGYVTYSTNYTAYVKAEKKKD